MTTTLLTHLELPSGVRVWFSADHHFGHANIIRYADRPYPHVDAMDSDIIRRHNAVVAPTDVFFALGDLCLGSFDASLACAAGLNGIKFLMPGNHDRVSVAGRNKPAYIEKFRARYEAAGYTVLPEEGVTIDLHGVRLALSHYPYQGDHTEQDRHLEFRPKDEGLPLLHGHIHGERRIDGRMFNVGVDVNDFTPVSEEQVLEFAKAAA